MPHMDMPEPTSMAYAGRTPATVPEQAMTSIHDFTVTDIDGKPRSLGEWRGKTLLVVNVASQCGFTPQYEGLEALWREQRELGLVVLGFPCDQFGHQEPGSEAEIKDFCSTRFDVTFPMFAKVEVNGEHAAPLYQWLKSQAKGILGSEAIKWNFTKFLVDGDGQVVRRYAPTDTPQKIGRDTRARLQR
jgi:glutathione peroxidase